MSHGKEYDIVSCLLVDKTGQKPVNRIEYANETNKTKERKEKKLSQTDKANDPLIKLIVVDQQSD